MDDECDVDLLLLMLLRRRKLHEKKRKRRSCWVHPLNLERAARGLFHTLFDDLQVHGPKFFQYYRMSRNTFYEILDGITDKIQKTDTIMRLSIPPNERLALTIR